MPRSLVRFLLLLLVIAFAAWWLARPDTDGARRVDRVAPAADDEPRRDEPLPVDPEPPPAPPRAPVLLRGRLDAPEPRAPGTATIEVAAQGPYQRIGPPVRVDAEADFTFEVDVADLLARADVRELQVRVSHPLYLPAQRRVALAERFVTLALTRAGAVTGAVVDENGRPARADVAVFAGGATAPVETTPTDARGTYRLRVGRDGRYVVVAVAAAALPAQAPVELWVGRETEAPPLVLRRGAAITGRVLPGNRAATVRAKRVGEGQRVSWQALVRAGGTFVRGNASADTDAVGAYRLDGLEPGLWEVWCGRLRGAHMDATQADRRTVDVEAPADGVDLEVVVTEIVLVARAEGAPVPGLHVMIAGKTGAMSMALDEEGRKELGVGPGLAYTVVIQDKRFETLRREFTAPSVGERKEIVLDLQPARPRATLLVRLRLAAGEPGPPPPEAGFGLWPRGSTRMFPGTQRDVRATDGVFRVGDLDAGAYRVVVRPGGPWAGALAHFLPVETDIDVPEGGEVPLALEIRRGGRLRLLARTPDGKAIAARCTIRDAAGAEQDVRFFERMEGGWASSTGSIATKPTLVDPALPPGLYTVELSYEGYATATREVRLEAGATRTLEVTLAR